MLCSALKQSKRAKSERSFAHLLFLFLKVLLGFGLDFEFKLMLGLKFGLGLRLRIRLKFKLEPELKKTRYICKTWKSKNEEDNLDESKLA